MASIYKARIVPKRVLINCRMSRSNAKGLCREYLHRMGENSLDLRFGLNQLWGRDFGRSKSSAAGCESACGGTEINKEWVDAISRLIDGPRA